MSVAAVKVALAGISGYGDSYLAAVLPNERALNFQIVGVVDTMPQRCRRLGELAARKIPVYATLAELFGESDVDLMMIVTPTHVHAPQTCYALARGASVLCEKPAAGTLAEAMDMMDAQRKARGFAAIGFQWSFSAAVQSLKRDIMAGTFGKPLRMKALALAPRPLVYFRRNDWAGRMKTDGGEAVYDSPVNNATAHFLHNMLYLLGRTRETSAAPVSVEAELYRANDIENFDTAAMRVRTECGTELMFYTSHAVAQRGPESKFEFEHATIDYDAATGGQFVARFRDGRVVSYGSPNVDRHEKIWQSIDAVRSGGGAVACGIRGALPHTLCVAAAHASCPVVAEFPASMRRVVGMDGDAMVCVNGLAEALVQCYEHRLLPGEHRGLTWARRGAVVDLDHPEWAPRRHKALSAVYA